MVQQWIDLLNGGIRPLTTLIFAGSFVAFAAMGIISGELFATVAGMVITFWFKSRDEHKSHPATPAPPPVG